MNLPFIPTILNQHCEETSFLWTLRQRFLARSDIALADLAGIDERIDAHLDGVRAAEERGWKACQEALAKAGSGEVFTATTLALESRALKHMASLLAVVEADLLILPGLVSALGWASPQDLQGTVQSLLSADSAFHRRIGIESCAVHLVDPGALLGTTCAHPDTDLAARSVRAAGELGLVALLPVCLDQLAAADMTRVFWAAWSAVLLGDRVLALEKIIHIGLSPPPLSHPTRGRALRLALKVVGLAPGHELLKSLGRDTASQRLMVQGTGILGNARDAPWLIKQMEDTELARLAGEAFSLLTGVDLTAMNLRGPPPEDVNSGPNDNPDDPDVSMDPDDSLPWPDPVKIKAWWDTHKPRFTEGIRYFMGAPVTHEHCIQVLKEGYQHQRIAAAQYLCLLEPGTTLFPTSAPAWRQKRLLDKMC